MLDYKLVEALAMVIQEGGFEKAAQRLFITQSAVSQRIRLLEEQTGQVLLARAKPPRVTPAGRRMLKHYLQVKKLEEDLFDSVTPTAEKPYVTLAVGINSDSLATWFLEAVRGFLENERVLLDLRPEDQDRTHQLLKDGEVIGCISTKNRPIQGCLMERLGSVTYRLLASPGYAARWFPRGLNPADAARAPLVIFNRKDELHLQYFDQTLGQSPDEFTAHYLPSSERFVDFVVAGLACGMLPDQDSAPLLASGRLVELVPGRVLPVELFWHCWNLKSRLLKNFTDHLVYSARELLGRNG